MGCWKSNPGWPCALTRGQRETSSGQTPMVMGGLQARGWGFWGDEDSGAGGSSPFLSFFARRCPGMPVARHPVAPGNGPRPSSRAQAFLKGPGLTLGAVGVSDGGGWASSTSFGSEMCPDVSRCASRAARACTPKLSACPRWGLNLAALSIRPPSHPPPSGWR